MSDYKLVPAEPTPEMVESAESAYMLFGDMELALMMAVLAAPAVQGEPVGEVRLELGAQPYVFAELYSKSLSVLAPGAKLYTTPQPAEQPTISAYACTVPDDCETLHWRGQILSMNELVSVAQPAVDEEIHVHIEGRDVLTLPLASSGMSAPRFVVHVPAQPVEQQPAPCKECGGDGAGGEHEEDCVMAQIAPDVDVLVEALERIANMDSMSYHSLDSAKITARAALAAYRKQGGEV